MSLSNITSKRKLERITPQVSPKELPPVTEPEPLSSVTSTTVEVLPAVDVTPLIESIINTIPEEVIPVYNNRTVVLNELPSPEIREVIIEHFLNSDYPEGALLPDLFSINQESYSSSISIQTLHNEAIKGAVESTIIEYDNEELIDNIIEFFNNNFRGEFNNKLQELRDFIELILGALYLSRQTKATTWKSIEKSIKDFLKTTTVPASTLIVMNQLGSLFNSVQSSTRYLDLLRQHAIKKKDNKLKDKTEKAILEIYNLRNKYFETRRSVDVSLQQLFNHRYNLVLTVSDIKDNNETVRVLKEILTIIDKLLVQGINEDLARQIKSRVLRKKRK